MRRNHMVIALIDSDIIAYRSAILCEEVDEQHALDLVDRMHSFWMDSASADIAVPCLTKGKCFRKQYWADYKANRKDRQRPRHLDACIKHIMNDVNVAWMDGLEADDVMGILQTCSDHDTIIVTVDKDLDQIPGMHCNPDTERIYEVSPDQAELYRCKQVLTGDSTDNYPGCRGIGSRKADKILEHVTDGDALEVVKEVYLSKGYDLEYFYNMVRCATILTHEDLCESFSPDSSVAGTLSGLLATVMLSNA